MPTPKPDVKMVKKVKKYRQMGVSFRDISKILKRDIKQIHRWSTYETGKLSTPSR